MVRWELVRARLNPSRGTPIYVQLADELRAMAARGLVRSGERLPTIRELAVALKVNPLTVSRAYQELEREGLVVSEVGRGTFATTKADELARLAASPVGDAVARAASEARRAGLPLASFLALARALWEGSPENHEHAKGEDHGE